jgi:hypothetical protein
LALCGSCLFSVFNILLKLWIEDYRCLSLVQGCMGLTVRNKTTLKTSGEDVKNTLKTSGEDLKNTLQTGGEDLCVFQVMTIIVTPVQLFVNLVGIEKLTFPTAEQFLWIFISGHLPNPFRV